MNGQRGRRTGRPKKKPINSIREWIERYPSSFSFFAVSMAKLADSIFEWARDAQGENFFEKLGIEDWQSLFIDPPQWGPVFSYLCETNEKKEILLDEAVKHPNSLAEMFVPDFAKGFESSVIGYLKGRIPLPTQDELIKIHEELINIMCNDYFEESEEWGQFFQHPVCVFLITVSVPCWIYYQETVESLIGKIEKGDFEALQKIIRLDKRFMANKIVQKAYQNELNANVRIRKKYLAKAMTEGPEKELSLQSVKYMISAMLLVGSDQIKARIERTRDELLHRIADKHPPEEAAAIAKFIEGMSSAFIKPITLPALKELFDVVAKESSGIQCDLDIADTPKGFESAMRRYKPFWEDKEFFPSLKVKTEKE